MQRTKIIIVTDMETLLPMSVGMSMHRFSSSPGRSRAMLYMFLVVVVVTSILMKTMTNLSCSASSLSSRLSRALRLDSQWMMKPE